MKVSNREKKSLSNQIGWDSMKITDFSVMTKQLRPRLNQTSIDLSTARCESPDCLAQNEFEHAYLPTSADCALKSPVEFQRLPNPTLPLFTVFTDCGRGDGDGAGDIELLLGESDWIEPFDWWICLVRLWCNELTPPLCRREWMSGVVVPWAERTIGLRSFQSLFGVQFIPIDEFECTELCDDTEKQTNLV